MLKEEQLKFTHLRKTSRIIYKVNIDVILAKGNVIRTSNGPFDNYDKALKYIREQRDSLKKDNKNFIIYLMSERVTDNIYAVKDN